EDEVFGERNLRRERQERENDSCGDKADAVREAHTTSQHCNDGSDQEQRCSRLNVYIHFPIIRSRSARSTIRERIACRARSSPPCGVNAIEQREQEFLTQ